MAVDGYTLGVARQAQQSAANWKAYAEELERKLAVYAANFAGMQALKDVAVQELLRLAPDHRLAVQENRKSIYDSARSASLNKRT